MSLEKLDNIVSGVLYDFVGWLTTRPERLALSSSDDAAPAADAVAKFLELRGVDQSCGPMTKYWPARCSQKNIASTFEEDETQV